MSSQKIQNMVTAIEQDSQLKAKISNAKSVQEVSNILKQAGYEIDSETIKSATKESMPNLSDKELEEMSSGAVTTPFCVITFSIVVK